MYINCRYENTGAGNSLMCFTSTACDVTEWVVDISALGSGLPVCSGIQSISNSNSVTNNNNTEEAVGTSHNDVTTILANENVGISLQLPVN